MSFDSVKADMERNKTQETKTPDIATFATGAKRGTDHAACDLSLIPPEAIRAWGRAFAEGREKYGTHNWLKGFPQLGVINHALQHLYSYLEGDRSEDHLGHALWNIGTAIHQEKFRPDLMDLPPYEETRTDNVIDAEITVAETSKENVSDNRKQWHSETEVELPAMPPAPTKTAEQLVKEVYPHSWIAYVDDKWQIEHSDQSALRVYISDECETELEAWQSALNRINQANPPSPPVKKSGPMPFPSNVHA